MTSHHYYLTAMGIERWVIRNTETIGFDDAPLIALQEKVANCVSCTLCETRTQTVFSRGNPRAKLMIIGEAPGFHEDQQGKPFVGKAGGLLDRMMQSIDLLEDDFYIANVLKCRPPNNRDPNHEEIEACSGFLAEQIELIQPKILLAVGRFAGQFLLKKNLSMNKMRGVAHRYKDIPVIVSFHPAYLLRKPTDKRLAFADLLQVKQYLMQ